MDETLFLEQQAIDAAIRSDWTKAADLNEQIIKQDKDNTEAYLRSAYAYFQQNDIVNSKKYYKKALKLQPSNYAIIEYLDRIKVLEKKHDKVKYIPELNLDPNLFLEVPGKTKSIALVNIGQKNILAHLTIGQKIYIFPKRKKVEIRTQNKEYIGSLPDDVSRRLSIFIKAGSEFATHIKEANLNKVVVFIREEKKGKKVQKYTSFPANLQQPLDPQSMSEEEAKEDENEELTENDLEKLAESLAVDEKEYLPYNSEEQEEEPED